MYPIEGIIMHKPALTEAVCGDTTPASARGLKATRLATGGAHYMPGIEDAGKLLRNASCAVKP